jgi:Leucine-rich repeat (LRR) protein
VVNTSANFSVVASSIPAPGYQWQFNGSPMAGATTSAFVIGSVQTNSGGNYTVVVSNAANSVTSAVATLTVWVPPSIATQPQSLTNIVNTTANFSVVAGGVPTPAYQWQLNNAPISGATASTWVVANVQTDDAGNYRVVVTNSAGSITSAVVTLTVWVPPSITLQPQSQTVVLSTNISLTASATGTEPLSYQWRMNGTNLNGATGTSLSFTNIQFSNAGTYTLVVTNSAGVAISAAATVVVVEPDAVVFCDPDLEDVVRLQLGKATGAVNRLDVRNLTTLRGVDWHISSLCGLEWATNLTTLHLGNNLISDLRVLTNLTGLTNLVLYNNLATNLTPLTKLTNLNMLDLRLNPGITGFGPLSSLTNLSTLYLGGNAISNIAVLPPLNRLAFLDLDNNGITNASLLAGMTNLAGLDLGYNPNLNVQTLAGLTNVTSLYLSGNSLTNVAFLQNFPQLTNLCLYANLFTDISPIQGLANLRCLNLGANPAITNFSSLSSLTNLEALWVNNNSLATLSFIQPLGRLTYLAAHGNSITTAASLSGLTSLTVVGLENNLLTDSAGLSGLTNLAILGLGANSITNPVLPNGLVSLSLYGNQIASVSSLGGLSNLMHLNLAANPVANFSGLAVLTNLTTLSLFADGISNLAVLPPLVQLTSLDLGGNRISNVSLLQSFTNLLSLNVSSNQIANAAPLSTLVGLASLDIGSNNVADWSFLSSLINLRSLSVKGSLLSDLSFAAPLSRLTLLDATLNRITNSSGLPALTNLHYFLGGYNRLRDLSNLTGLPRLWRADLRTNLVDLAEAGQVSAVQTLTNRLVALDVLPQNRPPTIAIADYWPVGAAATSSPLYFTVSDDVTPDDQITLNAISSNPGLIPNGNISFGTTSSNRYILFTPSPNQTGLSQITVTATDDTALNTNVIVQLTVITQQNITVVDPNLRAVIRTLINKPTGSLNTVDMLKFSQLAADEASITNLAGLEYATNVTRLSLTRNSIGSVSPLQTLTRLSFLSMEDNLLADLSSLSGLTNLDRVSFNHNAITNIGFLNNLTRIGTLSLSENLIRDLSPLSGLTNLGTLYLDQNIVSNIIVLPNLPLLNFVDLSYNVLNTGAGSAAMTVISNLQANSVIVAYLPQRSGPGITAPANWLIAAGVPARVSMTIIDSVPRTPYILTATSTNSALLPNGNLHFSLETGIGWTLTATPVTNQTGTTTLTVTVKDTAGLTGSTVLPVTVVAQSLGMQFFNNPNLYLSSWGDAFWFAQSVITHSGTSAAQSGHILDNSSSWLGATIAGPGRLGYWSRASSEASFDYLDVFLNGVLQTNRLSGDTGWRRFVFNVPPGTNALAWRYQKDKDTAHGLDAGWLDEMNFESGVWLEIVGTPLPGQTQLMVHGVPGQTYEVQFSTNLVNWSLLAVAPGGTATPVIDTNVTPGNRFYRLHAAP